MRPRSSARMGSGAVDTRLRIWLSAWVRPFRAEDLATRKTRMDSTFPSLVLASPAASPERAARAAEMASWGSDLPLSRRRWRLGRSTSTRIRSAWRCRVSPRPHQTGPFDADEVDRAEVAQPPQQFLVALLGGGEALDAEENPSFVQSRSYMDIEVRIDAAGDAPCQSGHCHPFVGLGWGDTAPSGTTDRTATGLCQAGSY